MRFWTYPRSRCGTSGNKSGLSLWPVIVAAALEGLTPAAEPADGPPQVGAASIWTDGPTLIYGESLDGEFSYWLYSPSRDTTYTDADLRASLERVLAGKARALPTPPANARWAKTSSQDRYTAVLDVDVHRSGGFAAVIPQGTPLFGTGAVLWLKNGHGTGKPYILKEAEVWGANPAKAPPGETLTVWGVNLSYGYGLATSEGQVVAILRAYRAYGHSCRFAFARTSCHAGW